MSSDLLFVISSTVTEASQDSFTQSFVQREHMMEATVRSHMGQNRTSVFKEKCILTVLTEMSQFQKLRSETSCETEESEVKTLLQLL